MAITNQEIAVLRKMFAKTRAVTDPLVDKRNTPGAHPKAKELMAAQNVLRDCMTVVFNECMPIDQTFVLEMAMRVASYAISVAPVENQMIMAGGVAELFEDCHRARMVKGIGIEADWITDGVEHKNMPGKGDLN